MASLAESDALSCKINGPIAINVLKEGSSGRLNAIRRWDMTPATGKISEGQIDLDEDECPPAISIAGTDEDIMQILKQRLTVRDAEVLGRCQVVMQENPESINAFRSNGLMITPKSRSINSSNSFKKRPKNFD
jgi:hypothetical protein